jgi:hypothetical protein
MERKWRQAYLNVSTKKNVRETRRIQELLNNSHLFTERDIDFVRDYGIEKLYLDIKNPFDYRTKEDIENPHVHLLRLMRKPEYFGFACKYIFNIKLAPFQIAILRELWTRPYPMLIATRGGGKSFLLGLYTLMRCLFNQGSKIVVAGAGFRQSKLVLEYSETIWHNAPVLRSLVGEKGRSGRSNGIRKAVDRWDLVVGDSVAVAVPIGDGARIRGLRATHLICDEFSSLSEQVYEDVISGFAAVSADPVEKMGYITKSKMLNALGEITDEEATESKRLFSDNQSILSGTAYYSFNHFYKYWNRYKKIIESKGDKDKLYEAFGGEVPASFDWRDYSIIRIPADMIPEGFMDSKNIARSKATVHSSIFGMEYGAIFATDSNGFFKRSLVESCVTKEPIVLPSGSVQFTAAIRGSQKYKYVYGVDPASEDDSFAIVVIELHNDHRRIVYSWTTNRELHKEKLKKGYTDKNDFYGYCTRKIRDLMKIFPCERIALDTQGGGRTIEESLHDNSRMEEGELPIWATVDSQEEKDTDDYAGLHILDLISFAKAEWVAYANHGMRKDFEDRVLLFPFFDTIEVFKSIQEDKDRNRLFDTLEDAMLEIEELKDELATIVHTQTPGTGRDHWDTPEIKKPGGKKGRMRKDRYTALLMANAVARKLQRTAPVEEYKPVGGFVGQKGKVEGALYVGPQWWTDQVNSSCYGGLVKR